MPGKNPDKNLHAGTQESWMNRAVLIVEIASPNAENIQGCTSAKNGSAQKKLHVMQAKMRNKWQLNTNFNESNHDKR